MERVLKKFYQPKHSTPLNKIAQLIWKVVLDPHPPRPLHLYPSTIFVFFKGWGGFEK